MAGRPEGGWDSVAPATRRNAVLGLFDRPLYRDPVVWLGVSVATISFVAQLFPQDAREPSWVGAVLSVVVFLALFGMAPAAVRLTLRSWRRDRGQRASLGQPPAPHHEGQAAPYPLPPRAGGNAVRPGPPAADPQPDYRRTNRIRAALPVPRTASSPTSAPEAVRPPADPPSRPRAASPAHPPRGTAPALSFPKALAHARQRFPYPVADGMRALQNARSARERYEAVLRAGDVLSFVVGMCAASWLRQVGSPSTALTELRTAYLQRGVTAGRWHDLVHAAAAVPADANEVIPGLADALRDGPRRELLDGLGLILQERNRWAHSAGPRTDSDATQRVERLLPALETSVRRSSFLAQSPWVLVEACSFRRLERNFVVSGRSAMGDHPDFELMTFESPMPLADSTLYIRCRGGDLDLTPFIVIRHCALCHERELFFADRVDGPAVVLKGFRHGQSVKERTLLPEISALGQRSAPQESER